MNDLSNNNNKEKFDPSSSYPLGEKRPDLIKNMNGLTLDEISLTNVLSGKIGLDDIKICPETLEYQAKIADSINRTHLADNLRRAAEMTRIPDERLLEIYNSLRPYRSTKIELLRIADELENVYQAKVSADFIRESAEVYDKTSRLKK
jgi:propanediol dehydratase small subunit